MPLGLEFCCASNCLLPIKKYKSGECIGGGSFYFAHGAQDDDGDDYHEDEYDE